MCYSFDLLCYPRKCKLEHIIHYLANYRFLAHKLVIEQGRHNQIVRLHRIYRFCYHNMIKDEFHFILECPRYSHVVYLVY